MSKILKNRILKEICGGETVTDLAYNTCYQYGVTLDEDRLWAYTCAVLDLIDEGVLEYADRGVVVIAKA